jgi:hypothetical protein
VGEVLWELHAGGHFAPACEITAAGRGVGTGRDSAFAGSSVELGGGVLGASWAGLVLVAVEHDRGARFLGYR